MCHFCRRQNFYHKEFFMGVFGDLLEGFLEEILGGDEYESPGDFIDRYSDSRSAAGAVFSLDHPVFSGNCTVTVVIIDQDGDRIDSHQWDHAYDSKIKEIFRGKKEVFYAFD
jgi:hypothetical protein